MARTKTRRRKGLRVKVLQRGGVQDADLVEKAVRFYAEALLSTKLANQLTIRVELRATKLDPENLGTCQPLDDGPGNGNPREFRILLRRDYDRLKRLKTLAHEMAHVEQFARGRLRRRFARTMGPGGRATWVWRWEGARYGPTETLPEWQERPWEQEAQRECSRLWALLEDRMRRVGI